jgi:hypothetical protein
MRGRDWIRSAFAMRIALIHTLRHSFRPIEMAFARLWPEAELMYLLDDSLSTDLAKDGRLTSRMTEQLLALMRKAASTEAVNTREKTIPRIDDFEMY